MICTSLAKRDIMERRPVKGIIRVQQITVVGTFTLSNALLSRKSFKSCFLNLQFAYRFPHETITTSHNFYCKDLRSSMHQAGKTTMSPRKSFKSL
jgi:hypothetical protein